MQEQAFVAFLQRALPHLGLRWRGFRRVRKQVKKRLTRRLQALALSDLEAYEAHLAAHPDEWDELARMCRITISRFYRDHRVFDRLQACLPPLLQRFAQQGTRTFRVWSAGCASGEEAYTFRLLWDEALEAHAPTLTLALLATDANAHMLARAQAGIYDAATLRELPQAWQEKAFEAYQEDDTPRLRLREAYRSDITFAIQELRSQQPDGAFHLIFCRNLAFTYFDEATQVTMASTFAHKLHPGGLLVLGKHESLPPQSTGFVTLDATHHIYQKADQEAP